MRITLTTMQNEAAYDVCDDMTVRDLLCLANFDLGIDVSDVSILRGAHCLASQHNQDITLKDAGIVDGDLLAVVPNALLKKNASIAPAPVPNNPSTPSTSSGIILSAELRKALASIKVKRSPPKKDREVLLKEQATKILERISTDKAFRTYIFTRHKTLFDQWSKAPENIEAFVAEYTRIIEKIEEEERMKNDPTSVEGQRLIQEEINRERIEHTYQVTYEHHPEYLVRCSMLYINMEINKTPVCAFVDSGAQTSIMSEDCARRCGLIDLIDRESKTVMNGVGGQEESIGRIHACNVKIENHHFLCPFEVMKDRNTDILFGLNVLRIHRCNINLKDDTLEMGDGTVTPFLTERQIAENNRLRAIEETRDVVVDEDKIDGLVELGFTREDVIQMLKMTRNDVDLAVFHLYNKKLSEEGNFDP